MPVPGGVIAASAAAGLTGAALVAWKRREVQRRLQEWIQSGERLPGPAKTSGARVCIYQIGQGGETAFATVCNTLWREWGFERHGVRSRDELQRVLQQYPTYERLVMAAHGDPSWYFAGFGSINPQWMAQQLRGRVTNDTIISLAGCRAGSDPGTPEYTVVPGGSSSFAAQLRDLLLQQGAPSGGQIRSHTTTGHTTENPFARSFTISNSNIGADGRDVELARGEPAKRWILALAGFDGTGFGTDANINVGNALGVAALAVVAGLGIYSLYEVSRG